jgi:dimethylglycine catabolism B
MTTLPTPPGIPLALRPDGGFLRDLIERAGDSFERCYQCGTCSVVCPFAFAGTSLPRQEMALAQWGLRDELLDSPNLWLCTTCGNCARLCPREVDIPGTIRAARELYLLERGATSELTVAFENTTRHGNPLGLPARRRADWAAGAGVEVPVMSRIRRPVDVLLWVECYWSYHPRGNAAAQAMARILTALGVDFGILGAEERCVADSQRLAGETGIFEESAERNLETLGGYEFSLLVTPDPHAYNAFRNLYPAYGSGHAVQHYTQFLAPRIADMALKPIPERRVTFHDPCYLGRHNGEFEAPRRLLEAVPGVTLTEMAHCRADGYCCGGGGGGMWNSGVVREHAEERLAEVRVREAVATGAEVLAVCCPFEVSLFEDAVRTTGNLGRLAVRDIVELLDESMR